MGKETLVNKRGMNGALGKQSNDEFRPGDITWIKLRGASWWPAQIVDEVSISDINKPRKRKCGEVLVRLYGAYKYLYMDPVTSLLEFNNVIQQNKSTPREIFKKALEQDLSELQSGRTNAQRTKFKGNENVYVKRPIAFKRGFEEHDDDTLKKPEGSARRLKVMQDLGLTAPSGSPFLKNGQLLSVLQ